MYLKLGRKIKELRKILKLNQNEFAYKIDTTARYISKVENEESALNAISIAKIYKTFKVNLCWLLLGEEPMFRDEKIQEQKESDELDKMHMHWKNSQSENISHKIFEEQQKELEEYFKFFPTHKEIILKADSARHEIEQLFKQGFFVRPNVIDIIAGLTFLKDNQMKDVVAFIDKITPSTGI